MALKIHRKLVSSFNDIFLSVVILSYKIWTILHGIGSLCLADWCCYSKPTSPFFGFFITFHLTTLTFPLTGHEVSQEPLWKSYTSISSSSGLSCLCEKFLISRLGTLWLNFNLVPQYVSTIRFNYLLQIFVLHIWVL